MTTTRASIERTLIARCGRRMAMVGFSIDAGYNPDLEDPILTALAGMGADAAGGISDGLLAAVDNAELLARAELRLLENIYGNLDMVDIRVGPRQESLGQLAQQLEKAIARLQEKIERNYGGTGATLSGISLGIDERGLE